MSLKSGETPSLEQGRGRVSPENGKTVVIKDREVLMRMIRGGLREEQILRLQNTNSPEKLLSTLERLGRETPINLSGEPYGKSATLRFRNGKVYLMTEEEKGPGGVTSPLSWDTIKETVFGKLLEDALAGEGTICAGN